MEMLTSQIWEIGLEEISFESIKGIALKSNGKSFKPNNTHNERTRDEKEISLKFTVKGIYFSR